MNAWTASELSRLDASEEVRLATARPDGALGRAVTIWVVRDGADVYVRAVGGREAGWFRAVQLTHEGQIRAGSLDKRVTLVEIDQKSERIDEAYLAKYGRRYPGIVPSIIAPPARSATLMVAPRDSAHHCGAGARAGAGQSRPFRPGCANRMAYASARSDDLRDRGRWLLPAARWAGGGHPSGRPCVLRA